MSDTTKLTDLTDTELDIARGGGQFLGPLIGSIKDLEAEDRLANHEIQRTADIRDNATTLEANIAKKAR